MTLSPLIAAITGVPWAMEPDVFGQMVGLIERHVAGVRLTADQVAALQPRAGGLDDLFEGKTEAAMRIEGSIALVPVRGVLARYADQVNGACQPTGRSHESLQADLRTAAADPAVKTVILAIDSPGGSVAGTAESAELIRAISASGKQVIAYVDGLAASAAYWLASQADEIVASASTAMAGSIGVVTGLVDASRAMEDRGYKVHVIRSQPLKAVGAMNAAVDGAQIASVQRMVADLHQAFAVAVQAGRGMDDDAITTAATGEVFTAARAQALGLVDRIASLGDVLAAIDPAAAARIAAPLPAAAPATVTPAPSATATPTPTPTHSQESLAMKHAIFAMSLVAQFAEHAPAITAAANAPDATEGSIQAALMTAVKTDTAAKLDAGKVALQAEQDAHAKTKADLATANAKITALGGKVDKLEALGNAGPDAGGAPTDGPGAGLHGEAKWKAEFAASADLQKTFFANTLGMEAACAAYCSEQADLAKAKSAA